MSAVEILKKNRRLVAAVVGAITAWLILWGFWLPPQSGATEPVAFVVLEGQGTRTIGAGLQAEGFIRSSTAFVLYTRLVTIQSDLKAGTYLLSPAMTVPEIADIIAGGRGVSNDIEVTIPEGMNTWDIDRLLVSAKLVGRAGSFASAYRSHEGRLFPETYRFAKDATISDIVARMTGEFQARASRYLTAQVIIASILEKEAKTPDDMALVSGIIAQRMALGMPLQVDATVGYGWCLRIVRTGAYCDVTQAPVGTEIKVDGPYNTYTRKGLPIGPISNPGLEALQAATHPKSSDFLYYLSTRDGSRLVYAKTLGEHLANRAKYLGF